MFRLLTQSLEKWAISVPITFHGHQIGILVLTISHRKFRAKFGVHQLQLNRIFSRHSYLKILIYKIWIYEMLILNKKWRRFWSHGISLQNYFLSAELHIILKSRNLKIKEHLSFCISEIIKIKVFKHLNIIYLYKWPNV